MRFIVAASLAALASPTGTVASSLDGDTRMMPLRQLVTTPPSGYSLVGANIDGVNDSNGIITTSMDADFGSDIAISDDGTRIVVGAWASNGNGTNVEQKGGVFIYDWGGTEWNYLTHLEGSIAPVGKTLTLSPDGALLALRVSAGLHRVYDITSGTLTQVGSDVVCASGAGTGLAFTRPNDSSLLLASGCSSSNNNGTVKVVQYTNTTGTWTADSNIVETPPAGTIGTLFGFDLAWNAAGTRLAIGEPNFDDASTGGTDNGRVLVYDFDGTSFTSFGTNIVGSDASKLGFSLALNDDGTTLVFGSPNKDVNTGDVKVYKLNTAGDDYEFQQTIVGDAIDEGFGRFIHVSSDGSKFLSASNPAYNGERGQVKVYELSSGTWTKVAEFLGDANDELTSAAMTPDGSQIAMGSVNAKIAQVFETVPTPAPTPSPVSTTPVPTLNVIEPGTFDWDIEYLPNATQIIFSENATGSELELHYNISIRSHRITAYQDDCTTEIPDSVTSVISSSTNVTDTHADLEVLLDIQQETVTNSPIWTSLGIGQGQIAVCIRVDLVLGELDTGTSVTFHEQKLYVDIDLTQGFQVTDITLDRTAATNETGTAQFDYEVSACHCDPSSFDCYEPNDPNSVLTQGSDILLCVETTAPNVRINDIRSLTMTGDDVTNPIVNGNGDALTQTTVVGKKARIRYQVISSFFQNENPTPIVASGIVLLEFFSEGSRMLRSVSFVPPSRDLEEELNQGFAVDPIPVESAAEQTSSASLIGGFLGIVVGGVFSMTMI